MVTLILFLSMLFSNPSAVLNNIASSKTTEINSNETARSLVVTSGNIDKGLEVTR